MIRLPALARLLLPSLVALVACNIIDSNAPDVEVALSQSDYTKPAEGPVTVSFSVHNTGDTWAYFSGCGGPIPVTVEREVSGSWEVAGDFNICSGLGSVPNQISMEPGGSRVESIPVSNAGTYRLQIYFGSSIGAAYAFAIRSGTFQVH